MSGKNVIEDFVQVQQLIPVIETATKTTVVSDDPNVETNTDIETDSGIEQLIDNEIVDLDLTQSETDTQQQSQEETQTEESQEDDNNTNNNNQVTIPTVMLTKSDAIELQKLFTNNNNINPKSKYKSENNIINEKKQNNLKIRLHLSSTPIFLDRIELGSYEYPKLRVRSKSIQMLGQQNWGLVLISENNKAWQLFIMKNSDINSNLLNPYVMKRQNIDIIDETGINNLYVYNNFNSIQLYQQFIEKKCPIDLIINYDVNNNINEIKFHQQI